MLQGQLGRMLCEAASPLDIEILILDDAGSPAKQINSNPRHVDGSFKDAEKIRELARRCDVLTVEIEHVDVDVLKEIAMEGVEVKDGKDGKPRMKKVVTHPSWETLSLIRDKYLQKQHYAKRELPIAEQLAVSASSEQEWRTVLKQVGEKLGFPYMLKARTGSYDGRGNFKVGSEQDFEQAIKEMSKLSLYAEKWANFKQELAVMVVRTEDDDGRLKDCTAFPAVETVHEESICTKVFMPPRSVSNEICEKARSLACKVIRTLSGRGVFAVEMFLLGNGELLINEVAPRPHNSGHYTIEAIPYMSQYKAQLYSILGLPIPNDLMAEVDVKSAIMLNILGGAKSDSHQKLVQLAKSSIDRELRVYPHLYGKASKPSRKIGHITTTSRSLPIDKLAQHTAPMTRLVDGMREERLASASEQLRPQASSVATASTAAASRQSKASADGKLVLVTMGSDSDLPVLKAGLDILEAFEVPFAVNITSAHRTPSYMAQVAHEAADNGFKVIIAAAGGAAHLPGMFASHTPLPVIGVPVAGKRMGGEDSLYSIVQMPRGVPVATVGIDNSTNAALLAVRILGASMPEYMDKMEKYQKDMEEGVYVKRDKLQAIGHAEYLKSMK
jgi:phosphoribosylaminoimidazole carboxylase